MKTVKSPRKKYNTRGQTKMKETLRMAFNALKRYKRSVDTLPVVLPTLSDETGIKILVLCHDYKEHQLLTLVTDNYTYLTPDNIKNITSLTGIDKICFIDIATRVTDEYQYNRWEEIDDYFDYYIMVHCPFPIDVVNREHLKPNGKIINVYTEPGSKLVEKTDVPFIVPPYSQTHSMFFGPKTYFLEIYDNKTNSITRQGVHVNKSLLPYIDDYGRIHVPSKK